MIIIYLGSITYLQIPHYSTFHGFCYFLMGLSELKSNTMYIPLYIIKGGTSPKRFRQNLPMRSPNNEGYHSFKIHYVLARAQFFTKIYFVVYSTMYTMLGHHLYSTLQTPAGQTKAWAPARGFRKSLLCTSSRTNKSVLLS